MRPLRFTCNTQRQCTHFAQTIFLKFAKKRAPFNGMRGKRAPFNGMRGKREEEKIYFRIKKEANVTMEIWKYVKIVGYILSGHCGEVEQISQLIKEIVGIRILYLILRVNVVKAEYF